MKSTDSKSQDKSNTGNKLSGVIYILFILLIAAVFVVLKGELKEANDHIDRLSNWVSQVSDKNNELENELKQKQMEIDALAYILDIEKDIYDKVKDYSLDEIPEFSITNYRTSEDINSTIIAKNQKQLENIQITVLMLL